MRERGHAVSLATPEMPAHLVIFWSCFVELSSTRTEGPIPWTAIDTWARRYEIAGEAFEDLVTFVRALDETFLKVRADEQKRKLKSKGA